MNANPSEHVTVPPAVADSVNTETSVALAEAQPSPGMAELFGLRVEYIGAQVFNFAIVVFIISRFMAKPILASLRERSRMIAENVGEAERLKNELADAEAEAKKERARSMKEAREEAERVKKAAEEQSLALHARAEAERAAMIADAEEMLAAERARLVDDAADMAAERMERAMVAILADADPKTVRASVETAWQEAKGV